MLSTSGMLPPAVWVESLSQYAWYAENEVCTLMVGFFCWNSSTTCLVRFARPSLPHHTKLMVVSPFAPLPPEPHAAASSMGRAATSPQIRRRLLRIELLHN